MSILRARDISPPSVAFSVAVLVILFALTWNVGAIDMNYYFVPWVEHLHSVGPVGAFAKPFSNYTPLSLYPLAFGSMLGGMLSAWSIIKIVFFAGHILLVLALSRLLRVLEVRQHWRWAVLFGLAPSLFANPGLIGQCDAYWAAALVMAVSGSLQNRHGAMFLWFGLAVGMKLQAAFMGPFFLAVAPSQRVPLRLWLMAPVAYVGTMLPAALVGWPIRDLALVYFQQVGWSDALALNAPNVWMLTLAAHLRVPAALPIVSAVSASFVFVWWFAPRLRHYGPADFLRAACLCAMIVPGLLPRMHERYFFMADVLTLVLAAVRPGEWRPALCAQLGSSLGILAYFTDIAAFACAGAIAMIYGTILIVRGFLPARSAQSDKLAVPA